MREIELEEGEAYFLQDDDDGDKIDPDKDFSYIDRKIENVLGHYQKDFMGGLSAESLGARYGGYGSFLPMQQRSPSILSNQRTQSHVSSKSPRNLPSERSLQNPIIAANHSLPPRLLPASSDHSVQAVSESGISSINNQLNIQSSGEFASNHQQKKPMIHHSEQNSLKLRVKMASKSVVSLDNSAIYSGLGLDMSPSSPEGSPFKNDRTSPDTKDTNAESPSFIVKIMTSFPLSNDDLLSPLHDSLIYVVGADNNLETGLPGIGEAFPVNVAYSKENKEASKERKPKLKNANKVKKSKHKEGSKERKSKQKVQSQKPVELVKKNYENPANDVSLSAGRRAESGTLVAKEAAFSASNNGVDAHSEETELVSLAGKRTGSRSSIQFDKKSEVGCSGEDIDNPKKQVRLARHKAKEEHGSESEDTALEDKGNVNSLRQKTEKDKNIISIPRSESSADKRNEVGWRENEVNKFMKQQNMVKDNIKEEVDSACRKDKSVTSILSEPSTDKRNEVGRREDDLSKFLKQTTAKDKVKEKVLGSACPEEAVVKENGMEEKIPKDRGVFVSLNDVEEKDKHYDISQEMKYRDVETPQSSQQKSHTKAMTHLQMVQGLPSVKDSSSSVVKKKLKETQIDGVFAAEPPRGSLMVSSSAAENEDIILRSNVPSKSKRGGIDLHREMRKDNEVPFIANPRKKGKEVSSKDSVIGVSDRETQAFTRKLKDKSSSKTTGLVPNIGSNMEGDLAGGMSVTEKVPLGDVLPPENASVLTLEDWVQCEKCQTWRLLPLGTNPDSLPKKWICSMITWLPGMNKCNVSEDETTNGLRALYVPMDLASQGLNNQQLNSQQSYLDGSAFVNASAGAQSVSLPGRATIIDYLPRGGKRKNLVKTEIDAAGQSGFHDLNIPVKKDPQHFSEIRNSKNQNKLPRESNSVPKNVDGKPSKIEKKRVAEVEVSGLPKKGKRVYQQSMENLDLVGQSAVQAKGESQNYDPGVLRISQDFVKGSSKSPLVKAKDRTQCAMTSREDEINGVSGKKRNLKDQRQSVVSAKDPSGKGQHPLNNRDAGKSSGSERRKEKKPKTSNFQASESSTDKRYHKTHSNDGKLNHGSAGDNALHERGRTDDMPLEQYHVDSVSRKTAGVGKSSEKALDLGLSDNATASSSSKISCKVKAKAREVKSSPIGSISSSPLKVSKSDPDKGTSKMSVSYNEQRLKSEAESASDEFASHNEETGNRKSNLSRNSSFMPDAAVEGHFVKKVSSGRHHSTHRIDSQARLQDYNDAGGKLDRAYHEEGTLTSQQNLVAENQVEISSNRLHFDGNNSVRRKSRVPQIDSEKNESSIPSDAPEFERDSGSNAVRVDDHVNGKLSGEFADDHASLRNPYHPGHVSKDGEASSSRKKDNFHRAAKTAFREATDLKHSANRLKIAGSGSESTGIFFQAALKFLHGASLLDPDNNESGRAGEMMPNEVYTSTAKLCEYCAHEYERCNDMASAALAYKCVEVAYMRVIYYNDLAASRDRTELQMAVRAAPQVESPSSSASDIDNLNNQAAVDTIKDGHSVMDHRYHVISAGNRPNFMRLLDFTNDINLAMEASRRSQSAFAAANPILTQAGNEEGISSIKRVLDFSFHDVDGLLHLVRLAMECIKS